MQDGKVDPHRKLTEKEFESYMDTKDVPDPDLLIRTSAEQRLSNFLLWELAYTEFVFCDKLWPDFEGNDLSFFLNEFRNRHRRLGS